MNPPTKSMLRLAGLGVAILLVPTGVAGTREAPEIEDAAGDAAYAGYGRLAASDRNIDLLGL